MGNKTMTEADIKSILEAPIEIKIGGGLLVGAGLVGTTYLGLKVRQWYKGRQVINVPTNDALNQVAIPMGPPPRRPRPSPDSDTVAQYHSNILAPNDLSDFRAAQNMINDLRGAAGGAAGVEEPATV
jgi:hypothetical protein